MNNPLSRIDHEASDKNSFLLETEGLRMKNEDNWQNGDLTVTILVPIYNVERYIGECAESLFGQTYADIEYVFVDDCTPDNSIAVLRGVLAKYPERRKHVRIIRMEHNTGIGGVRARLVGEVRTEWFTFADSDDILPNEAIEILVKRMQETDVDIVDGAYLEYNAGRLGSKFLPYHGSHASYQRKMLCQNILKNNVWSRLYKSSVLDKIDKLFEPGIDYGEDFCASVRLAMVTTRAWTDRVVYHYRTDNPSSYTKSMSRKNFISYLRATRRVLISCLLCGHLSIASEIGTLNIYRLCHQNRIPATEVDDVLQYVPEHMIAKLLYRMLHSSGIIYTLGEKLYRIIRMIVK